MARRLLRQNPRDGDTCWEVEWYRATTQNEEYAARGDHDLMMAEAEQFPSRAEAEAHATRVAPGSMYGSANYYEMVYDYRSGIGEWHRVDEFNLYQAVHNARTGEVEVCDG